MHFHNRMFRPMYSVYKAQLVPKQSHPKHTHTHQALVLVSGPPHGVNYTKTKEVYGASQPRRAWPGLPLPRLVNILHWDQQAEDKVLKSGSVEFTPLGRHLARCFSRSFRVNKEVLSRGG